MGLWMGLRMGLWMGLWIGLWMGLWMESSARWNASPGHPAPASDQGPRSTRTSGLGRHPGHPPAASDTLVYPGPQPPHRVLNSVQEVHQGNA